MNYKNTKELLKGDILAEDVQRNSVLILRAGTLIDDNMKKRLLKLGISEVAIETEKPKGQIEPSPSLSPEKGQLKRLFGEDMKRMAVKERYGLALIDDKKVQILENLFVSAMSIEMIYEKMMMLREWDPYSYDHSFDVFLLSSALGKTIGINDLTAFSVGCLLHDIGKLSIPQEILQKKGQLTAEEFEQIKHHTNLGYDKIRGIGLPEWLAILAKSHHERLDGSGYPDGLHHTAIDTRTRVLMIVDVYSALTWKRVYRDPVPADKALEMLFQDSAKFDIAMLKTFAAILHVFPVGSDVILSSGEKATVTYIHPNFPSLPRLRPFLSSQSIQIPFDLSLRIERLTDWDAKNGALPRHEFEWNRYLYALTTGESQEAMKAFEFLEEGKSTEDIHTDIFEKSMAEIEALYSRGMITSIELQLATTSTRELLYAVLGKYYGSQKEKGKIVLTTVDGEHRFLPLEISASALKTNGWKVYHLESPPPVEDLLPFLLRGNIRMIGFVVTSNPLIDKLFEVISFLRKEVPDLVVIVGGNGITHEAKKESDVYAKDSRDLIGKIKKYQGH